MSRMAKICWLISGLAIVVVVAARYILGHWIGELWIPLGLFAVSFAAALVVDFKLYLEFFTMRTTKHGMNMGALILMVLALLVAVNVLGVINNKTFDMTEEKLFTLSDQTHKVLDGLKEDVQVKVFYGGASNPQAAQASAQAKQRLKELTKMYSAYSSKVKPEFINAYEKRLEAEKYLSKGDGPTTAFVEYGGKRIKVEGEQNEEKLTSAIVKATREKSKKIYFLEGHDEKPQDANAEGSIADFVNGLKDLSYEVASLSLLTAPEVPADADIVAIVGPKVQILEGEVKKLLAYAEKGGRLFIAADPGDRHDINKLTEALGVKFLNNYVINEISKMVGGDPGVAMGMSYPGGSDITKNFSTFSLFPLASELQAEDPGERKIRSTVLVSTHETSFVAQKLTRAVTPTDRKARNIALLAEGNLQKDGKKEDEFAAVIFGDSDFLTSRLFRQGMNNNLALNSISYLAKESDLISISPKKPKGTKLTLTRSTQNTAVVAGIGVPIVFLILSGFFFYRRRNA